MALISISHGSSVIEETVIENRFQHVIELRKMGAKTIILCNNQNSPMLKNSDFFLDIYAGQEKSIAATKSFTMTITIIIKLIFYSINQSVRF